MSVLPRAEIEAFLIQASTTEAFRTARADWRMSRVGLNMIQGGIETAVDRYSDRKSPLLVVIEVDNTTADVMPWIEALAGRCDPLTKAIVIGRVNDVNLYRRLTTMGVSDYLVPPITTDTLVESFARALGVDASTGSGSRLVAVVGGKGGVGATSITQGLGWWLAGPLAQQCLLVDLAGVSGTLAVAAGVQAPSGVDELLGDPTRLDSEAMRRAAASVSDKLAILGCGGRTAAPFDRHNAMAVERLLDVALSSFPVVVADLPTSYPGSARDVAARASGIVVVATPTLAALRNARLVIDDLMIRTDNKAHIELVINQTGKLGKQEVGLEDIQRALGRTVAASIPFTPELFAAAEMSGRGLSDDKLNRKLLSQLEPIARRLGGLSDTATGQRGKPGGTGWLFGIR